MMGLLLLAIVGIYIAFAVFVVTRTKQRRARIMLTIVMIVLPFIESAAATLRMNWLCHTQSGITTYSRVAAIESLEYHAGAAPQLFELLPRLRQVVEQGPEGDYYVIERDSAGGTRARQQQTNPAVFKAIYGGYRDWLNVQHVETAVIERATGKVIAEGKRFSYHGDALVRLLSGGARGSRSPVAKCEFSLSTIDVIGAATSDHNARTHQGSAKTARQPGHP